MLGPIPPLTQRYFILLRDTTILLEGAVLDEVGLEKLRRLVGEAESVEAEETTEFNANSYEYVPAYRIDEDPRCGERNVFYDHNGNEWHN